MVWTHAGVIYCGRKDYTPIDYLRRSPILQDDIEI